jgi:cystathionine beta-lyase
MNFDHILDRTHTFSLKWENIDRTPGKKPVIPLWVADMDFPCPPEVTAALAERAAHPVYGYSDHDSVYLSLVRDWYASEYGVSWGIEDFTGGPGVVPSMGIVVRALSRPGDGVALFTPVYYPFYSAIGNNNRVMVEIPLNLNQAGRYEFSAGAVEEALEGARKRGLAVPVLLLCSPHNPGGTVWSAGEIETLLGLGEKYGFIIAADEIHGDFVFPPEKFTSIASFREKAERWVAYSSATKTFNLGGLHISHFVAPAPELRSKITADFDASIADCPDLFSRLAAETAYRSGRPWLRELRPYLAANLQAAVEKINSEIPGVKAYLPQGTYLIWADASGLARGDSKALAARLEAEARVKFTPGSVFGPAGKNFLRINAASPRALLLEGLDRLRDWA